VGLGRPGRHQQRLGGPQVGPDPEVEVGLALGADRRGQMEDHVGGHGGVEAVAARAEQVEQVAFDPAHTRVGGQIGRQRGPVDQGQLGDRLGFPAVGFDRTGGQ
jgi:hypothetical protein